MWVAVSVFGNFSCRETFNRIMVSKMAIIKIAVSLSFVGQDTLKYETGFEPAAPDALSGVLPLHHKANAASNVKVAVCVFRFVALVGQNAERLFGIEPHFNQI